MSTSNLPGIDSSRHPRALLPAPATRTYRLEPVETGPAEQAQQQGVLLDLWWLILGRKGLILTTVAAGLLLTALVTITQVPTYLARTTIEVNPPPDLSSMGKDAPDSRGSGSDSYLQTQVRILQSHSLRKQMAARMAQQPVLSTPAIDNLSSLRTALSLPQRRQEPSDNVEVKVIPLDRTRMIELVAEAESPELAARYLNVLTKEYTQMLLQTRWESAEVTTQWLTRQLDDLRTKLQQSEGDVQKYRMTSGMLFTDDKQSVEEAKLRQLQDELARAEVDRVAKQSAYEIAETSLAEAVPQIIDNGRLSGYQVKLAELGRELAELKSMYTPEHYRVMRVEAQIRELEATLRRERANIIARMKNDFDGAKRREQLLRTAFVEQTARARDHTKQLGTYEILKREAESNRRLYDDLLERVKGAGLTAAIQTTNVRVVDPAEVPTEPYRPSIIKNFALGLAMSLLLAAGLVLGAENINHSLKAPGEASYLLKLPELGVIPDMKRLPEADRSSDSLAKLLREPDWSEMGSNGGITTENRPWAVAESFRSTLASILFARDQAVAPRVILITSVNRGEGKSTTVANLGVSLAEIHQRVLLIDADMRKPHLHKAFGAANTWGLSDLLKEQTSLRDVPLEALARPTGVNGLFLLPSGPGTVSISSLLYSKRAGELLDRFRQEFDMVIIDTPPMQYVSDARVLGRLTDGVVIVIRASRTLRDEALNISRRLKEDGIPVLGTILNAWDLKNKSRYGAYRYPYGNPDSES
jgi:succinoglycan biosynthesis transport protein ExoP